MNAPDPPLIIGCEAVINEFKQLLPAMAAGYQTIDAGLHMRPEQLKLALQQAIEAADGKSDAIILGFGLCSNAVVGLNARHSILVVPRVDDCIAMFLGSQTRYKDEMRKAPGTYFLSRGWIDAGTTLVDEYNEMVKRYGAQRAKKLMQRMLGNYKRLAYIDMGSPDQEPYRDFSRRAAAQLELDYHELQGTTALLDAMLHGRWGDGFVVVPPGRTITLEDFKSTASGMN